MRGLKEQKCLDLVKNVIFTKNGQPIYHPYINKTYLDVTDEEFLQEQTWFINQKNNKNYFGLLEEDRKEIENILRMAKANEKASEFPDFIFDNGFIEHFQISSSKTTRKGAEHIREVNKFNIRVNKEAKDIKQGWNESPSFDKIRTKHWILDTPEHNHSFLIESFENNWKNHVNSINKYFGNKEIGIFMIEYADVALTMIENVYADWINGMSQGDMRGQEKFQCYRLSRDKKMLDFIYQYKEQIKYVIFVYREEFEIIRLENIPYLFKLLPWDYLICPMMTKTISSLYNQSFPNNVGGKRESGTEKLKKL